MVVSAAPHLFEREVAVVVRHVLHVDVQQLVRHQLVPWTHSTAAHAIHSVTTM